MISKKARKYLYIGFIIIIIVSATLIYFLIFSDWRDETEGLEGLISPSDLSYLGAFRLPYYDGNVSWSWGGTGAAFNPNGDPLNSDGYPGSMYGIGHDHTMYISEISIPIPIDTSNIEDLNTASTLRDFSNIRPGVGNLTSLFNNANIRYAGLAYLSAQGSQTSAKLYSSWGVHLQEDEQNQASHMWCDADFSDTAGAWRVGSSYLELYQSNDYMCEIPGLFSDNHSTTEGNYLATGRFREGGWGGQGPNLYAIAPWKDGSPPSDGTELSSVRLLGYSSTHPFGYDFGGGHTMQYYHDSDEWSGVSWLTTESKAALIFIGTKGKGNCWYGYSDGTEYPTDGSEFNGTIPDYPHDNRGYWSTSFDAEVIFYDPADLAAVAEGELEPYDPQPYARLSLDEYLFNIDKINHPDFPDDRNMHRLGGCTFDRSNGYLYIFEYRGEPAEGGWNDDNAIVHVFQVGN
ncbi:MAG: hypothetical protein GF329_13250 [Candidatus Lokiarchaeota archaeon]|nr:hypothetical protein [Candidatus Lokiarchaeota archaeon]